MVKVKVCGITNQRDAEAAAVYGADALGFVFAPSPRRLAPQLAKKIVKALGPFISSVGVFVNEKPSEIMAIVEEVGLTAVQLHGDESAASLKKISGVRVIKAFRVAKTVDLYEVRGYSPDAFLFDAKVEGAYGGTGNSFDWKIMKNFDGKAPFILSGGLNPSNVREAIAVARPYAVDVSSGVERQPGTKDADLIKEFIKNAKQV
jgi:phosphoribosylanthranilate isomerase